METFRRGPRHRLRDRARPGETLRIAGCSFWAWADYEEHSRSGPATTDGWTIEGLVDADGRPKPDLQILANMCFEMDHPPAQIPPRVEVLCAAPRRAEEWESLPLEAIGAGQTELEGAVEAMRRNQPRYATYFITQDASTPPLPRFGRLLVDGIEFHCRDTLGPAHPLLLGKGCEEVEIPVDRPVHAVAALGHVACQGGYPSSEIYSVHHRDAEPAKTVGDLAAEYEFVFEDGSVIQPPRHGLEILRANDICRWWTPAPRAPHTRPAARVVLDKTHEILRLDLWERRFPEARQLKAIHWRLLDPEAILLLYGMSVQVEGRQEEV